MKSMHPTRRKGVLCGMGILSQFQHFQRGGGLAFSALMMMSMIFPFCLVRSELSHAALHRQLPQHQHGLFGNDLRKWNCKDYVGGRIREFIATN